jgi:hypothetical protein
LTFLKIGFVLHKRLEGRVRGLGVRDEGRGVGGEGREVRGWKEKSKSKMEKEEIAYSV